MASDKFLDYVLSSQTYETKISIVKGHYNAIRREMTRRGTWCHDARILDVGCGLGLYTEYWNSQGLQVTGVDLDKRLIERAQKRAEKSLLQIEYHAKPANELPFDNESFDIVFANSLVEHVSDWQSCIEEWIRVLTPGGLVWIVGQRQFRT